MRILFIIGLISIILSGCKESPEEEVVAEAFGNKLYKSELDRLFTKNTSSEDSVFIVKEYINSWVTRQVILNEANTILSPEERDKSRELEAYKNDLISYEVLNKLAAQQVDSNFTEEELRNYYNSNIEEFELTENIVKIMFFRIPEELEKEQDLWLDFNRNDEDGMKELVKIAKEKGSYFTDTSSWLFFDDILKEIPINTYNQEHFLNNNTYIRINEGNYVYFVKIHDFRIKSGNSPFDLEKERIRKILFVQKQQETLAEIETQLVQKAYNNNKITTN